MQCSHRGAVLLVQCDEYSGGRRSAPSTRDAPAGVQVAERVEIALLRAQRRESAPLPHAQRRRGDARQPLRWGAPRVSVRQRGATTEHVWQCSPVWETRPV